jgi:DNA-binding beta-propeller fold protein YncE
MTRTRQLVGLLTLLALIAIVLGVSGVQLQAPGGGANQPALPGVKARAASTLVRAQTGGELAFLAVEPDGNLLVSDAKRASVLRYDPNGRLLSEWGPQLGSIQLVEPAGVAVAGDNYYVLDRGNQSIVRLDRAGQPQAVINLQPLGTYGLNGLAIDAAGNLYAADTGRNRILVFSPAGQYMKAIGHGGSDLGGFTQPMMLAFAPDGGLVVTDWENSRIERFDATLDATDAWSTGFRAFGVAVDPLGRVYAGDTDHKRAEVYSQQGASLGEIGGPDLPVLATGPKQLAVVGSAQPTLYVLGPDQIQRVDLDNTPPPPQSTGGPDLVSLLAIGLAAVVLVLAVLSRRQRRRIPHPSPSPRGRESPGGSLGPALERKVELHPVDGAQRQQQQTQADEELLIANQAERKQ